MALYLTEEQQMLADTARPFMADNAPVSHLRQLRDSKDPTGFSRDLWKQFAEMGFTGILAAEADGGLGLGHVEAGVVLEDQHYRGKPASKSLEATFQCPPTNSGNTNTSSLAARRASR